MDKKILKRSIEEKFKAHLFDEKKISIVYGPRQVGKTTFVKKILADYESDGGYFNCEDVDVRSILQSESATKMYSAFSGHKVVAFDEAQTVPNIGRALKILIDAHPEMTIIATGSSSFDLANKINEPLTGRHYEYFMFPLSLEEYKENFSYLEMANNLENFMIYGSYPEVALTENLEDKVLNLQTLARSYMYKDVLTFNNIKNSEALTKILKALALQIGGEVSFNEIAQLVGLDRKTVVQYINLLEQAFIVFRLEPLLDNERNAIKKQAKFYFYDNGILNTLTYGFADKESRDMGPLWENLMMVERKKHNQVVGRFCNSYFWRLKSGAEVDYIEEYDGDLHPFEFKYAKDKLTQGAKKFTEYYGSEVELVNRENYERFVLES